LQFSTSAWSCLGNPAKRGILGCLAGLLIGLSGADSALGGDDWRDLYLDAKPVLDVRYRFEYVDQDGVAKNAEANTIRTRAGLETGRFHGLGAGFDVEWIQAIGSEKFNSTVNGNTQYPVVADPDDEEINQLYLIAQDTIPGTLFKVGRQRINWDNQRFIGAVGFRQNEQTFDSFRGTVTALPDTELEYLYLDEVRRIFGSDSAVGHLGMSSHGMRARYGGFEALTITPFALLLDYDAGSQSGRLEPALFRDGGLSAGLRRQSERCRPLALPDRARRPLHRYQGESRLRSPGRRRHQWLSDTPGDAPQVQRVHG
jgi:hypothetical protein